MPTSSWPAVDATLNMLGSGAFRREVLRPVAASSGSDGLGHATPYYERHGEKRVIEGKYL